MKSITAMAFIVAFVVAEPPPSNSYLPPPRAGYPQPSQSLPQVVAARSQEFGRSDLGPGHGANGLSRNSLQPGAPFAPGHQARSNQGYDQKGPGYDQNAAGLARNGVEGNEPANYNFGYTVSDHHEGTEFGHHEERQEERAQGEYHVVLPDGRKQTVSYEADEGGFKPQISYEDTEDLTRSGYDSNANNFRSGYQDQQHGYQENQPGYQDSQPGYQDQHNDQNGGGHIQNGVHARAGGYN